MYLLPGVIGFGLFIIFDLNKIYWKNQLLNLFFVIGSILLAFSTIYSVIQSDVLSLMKHFGGKEVLALIALILSAIALVYALFFALPFSDTYVQSDELPLVNKGLYGTCRHPGFWMFLLFYFFLALLFSSVPLAYCFALYNTCNFVYIVIQDIFIFPQYIRGYNDYKKTVPFLVPTRASIRSAFYK